jgi:hypothetical protein
VLSALLCLALPWYGGGVSVMFSGYYISVPSPVDRF